MKAVDLKTWCDDNLSPVAWKRVLLHCASLIYDSEYDFENLSDPSADLNLNNTVTSGLIQGLEDLYDTSVPVKKLVAKK